MLLKGCMLAEGHSTKVALEHLLPGALAVGLHVSGQLAALSARVRAKLTLVRLLAGVAPLVHRQVAAVLENFSTKLATVIPTVAQQLLSSLQMCQ